MTDRYLQNLECFCVKGVTSTCPAGGEVDATLSVHHSIKATVESTSSIDEANTRVRLTEVDMTFLSSVSSDISSILGLDADLTVEGAGFVEEKVSVDYSLKRELDFNSELINTVNKINGYIPDFGCIQKLYPSGDGPIADGFNAFTHDGIQDKPLWSYIDEGVYQGISTNGGDSVLLSDDSGFIRPSSQVSTEGFFQYNALLTDFSVRPEHSRLKMRISAPLENYESKIAPLYTVYNIKLLDPYGDVIVKYKDFSFKGDSTTEHTNYTTYVTEPEYNIFDEYDWERRTTPVIDEVKDYSLVFSLQAISLDDPFDPGFDIGFEENYVTPEILLVSGNQYLAIDGTPLSTQGHYINPTRNFKLTALEICNSGGYGPRREDYLNIFASVPDKLHRLERNILPSFIPCCDFDTTIWPSVSGLWRDSKTLDTNEDSCGSDSLLKSIREDNLDYISLEHIHGAEDSGKLIVKFATGSSYVDEITKGAFNFEYDQSSNNRWWSPSGAFNTENRTADHIDNAFFEVDSITLKVTAKKAIGSRDYALDVVGYSDDKLLNITPASGGFIQDPSGVSLNESFIPSFGHHPILSGFYSDGDEFALGGSSLSEKDKYYEASGNDHYKLAQYPFVTSTEFQEYEIPLVIIDEQVEVGLGKSYNLSTLLEHVYLDIYPLPTGASISHMKLSVRYRPQHAMNMYSQGGVFSKAQSGRSEGALYPNSMGSSDDILNAGSGYGPISAIQGLPHAYTSPNTIKSNYSRRWRGVEGTVRGPYDPDMFGFGFENPVMEYPFVSGYFKFDKIDGQYVQSSFLGDGFGNTSGLFTTTPTTYQNIGWRYTADNANGLFQTQLPGYTGVYKTSDWTSLSDGTTDFTNDPLFGKIADSFDTVTRISQNTQNITFENIDVSTSGFSVFLRFTPDNTVSGVDYNLFDSGVLVSRWQTPADMDFVLCYEQGSLAAFAQDDLGNIIKIKDNTLFNQYTYPLNVLLTYTDDKKLRLYADNEATGVWDVLRAESATFDRNPANADIVVGWSDGSGVGMNMLVSEFGVSSGNIVDSNPDWTYKQVTAEKFLENSRVQYFDPGYDYQNDRYKLWDRVNEDTYNDWQIGAFQYCPFGPAFDQWQLRPNTEQIVFNLSHDGQSYLQKASMALPDFAVENKQSIAYHTQIENDFLRFHLSEVPNNFHAVDRRITKNLPVGYKFSEKALVVESVISHYMDNPVDWGGCDPDVGPKLIVSLYTKAKEGYWNPEKPWGLVNRKTHYIEPSSCIMRLDSTFSYDDICDESESWSLFDREPLLKEFGEKYFSDDVNQMFVQYDIVYPNANVFNSRLELHSSHVRMDNVNIHALDSDEFVNLYASGAYHENGTLTLVVGENPTPVDQSLPLLIGTPLYADDNMNLYVSGAFHASEVFNLYASNTEKDDAASNLSLYTLGGIWNGLDQGMNLVIPKVQGWANANLPLVLEANVETTSVSGDLPVFLFGSETANSVAVRDYANLYLHNRLTSADSMYESGVLNIATLGVTPFTDSAIQTTMPLYINTPSGTTVDLPLYMHNPIIRGYINGALNLTTSTYLTGTFYAKWDNENYGIDIDIQDNAKATVPINNEIRGVDLVSYGSCDGDSPSKAIDRPLRTDCFDWRGEVCNEGGIFRAKATYTNPTALSFDNTSIGYSGDYYGIRKFVSLFPDSLYQATMTLKTGNTDPIASPRDFEEWEYGMCGPNWYAEGCCTEDCDQDIVFSGVKFIGDEPFESNQQHHLDFLLASGRNPNDQYGGAVSIQNDTMLISSPEITIPDLEGVESSGAGAVFVYNRQADVAGKKAGWVYEDALMLPSGYRRDYVEKTIENVFTFEDFSIDAKQWGIGQEGRGLGTSLDFANSGDFKVAVVGAPQAEWFRKFEEIDTSGIKVGLVVVANEFNWPNNKTQLKAIQAQAGYYNILYKYFSAPWDAQGNEFQPEVDFKLVVLQTFDFAYPRPEAPDFDQDSSWIKHQYIPRLDGNYDKTPEEIQQEIFDGFLDAYTDAFPTGNSYMSTHVHSGIPPYLMLFEDTSSSMKGQVVRNGFNLFNEIENFYKSYSFESGVYDQTEELPATGMFGLVQSNTSLENWETTSKEYVESFLDTGNLLTTFNSYNNPNLVFLTSGVGQEWNKTQANEFNLPPSSGGRVFIFEKERNSWNCVQVIKSPNDESNYSNDSVSGPGAGDISPYKYNDNFGKSVSISKNADIVSVGSPFTKSPCRIYERCPEEISRLYDGLRGWFVFTGRTSSVTEYDEVANNLGTDQANILLYDAMSASDRFAFRNDVDYWDNKLPQQYVWTFEYTYQDIAYTGTNFFLASTFAPTSRLGWSTSVDDDGENVAFGAPTDSFNEFEDVNVWGTGLNSWASYNYAGAVRMFGSRQNYSHNGVVELGLFGNLDRNFHQEEREAGYYDDWNNVFTEVPWRRMDFSEIEIPKDAGLAFIITPELDAVSDEIIENIKDWLALGDRNLVLVGNDPVWEHNGLYKDSNDIINKILDRLNVDLRIQGVYDKTRAMPDCVNVLGDNQNITKALTPKYSSGTNINTNNCYAKGVGDIRIDLSQYGSQEFYDIMTCPEGTFDEPDSILNARCEMPHEHMGDLRAQWTEQCVKEGAGSSITTVSYTRSWPFQYGNFDPGCESDPFKLLEGRVGLDPVPVMTTREYVPEQIVNLPDTSGKITSFEYVYEWVVKEANTTVYEFAGEQANEIAFSIQEDSDSNTVGVFNSYNLGTFSDPEPMNGRDAILQGVARPESSSSTSYYYEDIYPQANLAIVESGKNIEGNYNNSLVYLIATQWSEDDASRGVDPLATNKPENFDQNTEFYLNLVQKDCSAAPIGIHLGGWTGRLSLEDAYFEDGSPTGGGGQAGHTLAAKLRAETGGFTENVQFPNASDQISSSVDYVWIANPKGIPSVEDLSRLQSWMNLGNKKLIITYNAMRPETVQDIADNVDHVCEKLNITSRPLFDPINAAYSVVSGSEYDQQPPIGLQDIIDGWRPTATLQRVNTNADVIKGCPNGFDYSDVYNTNTAVNGLWFSLESNLLYSSRGGEQGADSSLRRQDFVPISGGQDYENIIHFDYPIKERRYVTNNITKWIMDSVATIDLDLDVGSGYKVFMNFVSETQNDKFDICAEFKNISFDPTPPQEGGDEGGFGGGQDYQDKCQFKIHKTLDREVVTLEADFRATQDNVGMQWFTPYKDGINPGSITEGVIPTTAKFISMSGCPLDINSYVTNVQTSGKVLVDIIVNEEWVTFPGGTKTIPPYWRPTSSISRKYCNNSNQEICNSLGDELIEDGPIVVAEQPETFSSFPAGKKRSRVIVISDSTLVQGECPDYRSSTIGNQDFIRSLYPLSPEKYNDDTSGARGGTNFETPKFGQREWGFVQKLRSPESASPAKYYAISGHALENNMITPLFGAAGQEGRLPRYLDIEDSINPLFVARPPEITDPAQIAIAKQQFSDHCINNHGQLPLYSGDYLHIAANGGDYDPWLYPNELDTDRTVIFDAKLDGGLTELSKVNGRDYLELDFFYERSGCLGDLFGYSVDLSKDKIVIGSPFNAYYSETDPSGGIVRWSDVVSNYNDNGEISGIKLAEDGGAGAAFVFNNSGRGKNVLVENLPWELNTKIKPESANVGITQWGNATEEKVLVAEKGNSIWESGDYIKRYTSRSDNFGVSVAIDCDMIAVGSPNHDFETLHHHIYSGVVDPNGFNSAFLRKSFNAAFDIPLHSYYDLGSSGVRIDTFEANSGQMIINNGAVYNYRYKMVDFSSRTQAWSFAEKIVAQGYRSRAEAVFDGIPTPGGFEYVLSESGGELNRFGQAVDIYRGYRGDADYTLVAGAPYHSHPTNSSHETLEMGAAGSAYTYNAVLRGQTPEIPNEGGWMDTQIFGTPTDRSRHLLTRIYQNTQGGSLTHIVSGEVLADGNGAIFLEVSGHDPSRIGFISHRPYVESIKFELIPGTTANDSLSMLISGAAPADSGILPLNILAPDTANVYNNMNIYAFGGSGENEQFNLFTQGGNPELTLPMTISGQPLSSGFLNMFLMNASGADNLNLLIRGY